MKAATAGWLACGGVVIVLGLLVESAGLMMAGFLLILAAFVTEVGG